MDEPFSAVDAQTRVRMQELFLTLWEEQKKTVLLVTHDVSEAIALADRVVVMSPRPARVTQILDVPLPRPRHVKELFRTDEYQELLVNIWESLGQ
jgi:ABC-type nitrate/sulfonate/bicarbonate transport system ATPase subunit